MLYDADRSQLYRFPVVKVQRLWLFASRTTLPDPSKASALVPHAQILDTRRPARCAWCSHISWIPRFRHRCSLCLLLPRMRPFMSRYSNTITSAPFETAYDPFLLYHRIYWYKVVRSCGRLNYGSNYSSASLCIHFLCSPGWAQPCQLKSCSPTDI